MTGYSQRSLRDKLGIHAGMRLFVQNMPGDVMREIGDLDDDTSIVTDPVTANYFHYFITTKAQLRLIAETMQHLQTRELILWVSWPKQASAVPTEVTEQDLRDALLPIGLVDTKVASISSIYSGLKFVWRKQ